MSRQIDLSAPLSKKDKEYLVAFGSPDKIEQAEALAEQGVELPVDAEKARAASLAARANTGDSSASADELRGAKPTAPVVSEYTREDYESWVKADLQAEMNSRNEGRGADTVPPVIEPADQKNPTLVEALVADDEALAAVPE